MKITLLGVFATTCGALMTLTHGYSFSSIMEADDNKKEDSTDLTTNEESRIYGGSEANIDKYPFLVSLRDPFFDMTFCGGTLIAPQYVLTAGHCIKTDKMDIIATFGTNDSTGSGSGEAKQVLVIEGFRHPLYKKKQHLYDVGLLKLKTPVKRKTAKLCAADGSDNEVGTMGTVVGWGKTEDSSDDGSPVLEELTLPVISNAQCGKFKKYVGRVTEGMMCAGTGNGRDTCNGDSGGPLIVGGDTIIGCVSWGSKCGQQAGIFTRLTYVMDYIEDILAGGDGSKFNVTSSSSGSSTEDESQDASSEGSYPDATMIPPAKATKAPKEDLSEAASGSSSSSDLPSFSDLFGSMSGSSLDALLELLLGSATGSAEEATKETSLESSSEGLLSSSFESSLGSQSDSESASDSSEVPATKATKATKASKQTTEEEITKTPATKASKASKSSKTLESTSASGSSSDFDSVHQGDLVHQEDVTQQETQ